MAIKIGGTSIIDDNKNISNVGIVTIGASSSGKLNVGSGVTATGDGTISIAGTLYALDIVTPLKIDLFDPSDGATNVIVNDDIRITFNKAIGIGSTGFVRIKQNNNITDTFGVGSTYLSRADLNKTLVITPSSSLLKGVLGAANTVTTVVDASFIDDPAFTGINTTGSSITYEFETELVALGDAYEGGYFICAAGGTQWIVSPYSAEVSRNWYCRGDANTRAQAVSGCTGWFVPLVGQLQNPGFTCRTYWDSFSSATYWSNSANSGSSARNVSLANGTAFDFIDMPGTFCVRAFRCVTY